VAGRGFVNADVLVNPHGLRRLSWNDSDDPIRGEAMAPGAPKQCQNAGRVGASPDWVHRLSRAQKSLPAWKIPLHFI
jgi:hypothetical protein